MKVGVLSICRHRGWTGCLLVFQHVLNRQIPFAQLVRKISSEYSRVDEKGHRVFHWALALIVRFTNSQAANMRKLIKHHNTASVLIVQALQKDHAAPTNCLH